MRTVLAALVTIFGAWSAVAADVPVAPTTIDVMTQHVRSWTIQRYPRALRADTAVIDVAPHPDRAWFETMITAFAQQEQRAVFRRDTGSRHRIVLDDASTRYEVSDDPDSVVRYVTLRVREEHIGANGSVSAVGIGEPVTLVRRDVIARSHVDRLESTQHASTHGQVPERPSTFWDDIVQPVIYVGAAVVTVVLLFTVRSQ